MFRRPVQTPSARPPHEALTAAQLERWLCPNPARLPSRRELHSAFGADIALATGIPIAILSSRLRLTLAILQDAFADDVLLQDWLYGFTIDGERPLQLLLSGRTSELELLAVREWNRLATAQPSPVTA
jgi:hypothetical protein